MADEIRARHRVVNFRENKSCESKGSQVSQTWLIQWKGSKLEVCHGGVMEWKGKEKQEDLPNWKGGAQGEPTGHSYARTQDVWLGCHAEKYKEANPPVA